MDWFFLFLLAGAAIAIWRVVYQVRRGRAMPTDDWDAKLIERLRRGGTDPFRPLELELDGFPSSLVSARRDPAKRRVDT